MPGVRRVVLLTLGWEECRGRCRWTAPTEPVLREPVPRCCWTATAAGCCSTPDSTALIRDPALRRRFYGSPNYRPILPGPGEPLEEALDAAGIPIDGSTPWPSAICTPTTRAGSSTSRAGCRCTYSARNSPTAVGAPGGGAHAIFRVDFDDPRIDWRRADGDTEIAPGVTAV